VVSAFLDAARAAVASVGDPLALHEAIKSGGLGQLGTVESPDGTWQLRMHGLDIEYCSPSGLQVDLSFMGGEGSAVFDSGTIGTFVTINGRRAVPLDAIVRVCEELVADGSIVSLEDWAHNRVYALRTP
jgi:hypothetical protein